jgi:hypothetical protein
MHGLHRVPQPCGHGNDIGRLLSHQDAAVCRRTRQDQLERYGA